jgi:stage V sporulation protein K
LDQPIKLKNNGQINIILHDQKSRTSGSSQDREITSQINIPSKHPELKQIEEEMASLIGLDEMKNMVKEIYAWLYINKKREEQGLKVGKQVLHMLFKGNPGTGKTTVARLLGKLFFHMNVLSKGHLIESERADLVGEYIGHTAQKTRDLVKKAMGGILFIDEAYSLARGGEKDFGKEAIDTLVKHMEDKQNDFILILAGYSREMEHFLSLNPGLKSRFPIVLDFPDYSVDQLMEISKRMLSEKEYQLTRDAELELKNHLKELLQKGQRSFSNGRYIRNVIEKTIRAQAMRLLLRETYDRTDLMTIIKHDLDFEV